MGTVPQGSTTVGTLSESVRGQLLEYVEGQLSELCRTVGTGLRRRKVGSPSSYVMRRRSSSSRTALGGHSPRDQYCSAQPAGLPLRWTPPRRSPRACCALATTPRRSARTARRGRTCCGKMFHPPLSSHHPPGCAAWVRCLAPWGLRASAVFPWRCTFSTLCIPQGPQRNFKAWPMLECVCCGCATSRAAARRPTASSVERFPVAATWWKNCTISSVHRVVVALSKACGLSSTRSRQPERRQVSALEARLYFPQCLGCLVQASRTSCGRECFLSFFAFELIVCRLSPLSSSGTRQI